MRVLVVDDERSMSRSLQQGLEAEGYVVDVAEDGQVGLWMATEFDFDAVILDVMLPGLNGFVVARKLREAGRTVPILMLTAVDGPLNQVDALDDGADDYLTKPFTFEVLLARLRAVTRRAAGYASSILTVGGLTIDLLQHRVRRGDVDIELTAREFDLIVYLAHRADQVVTKTDLLRHVWQDESAVTPNAVEVYIGYLRRKIDLPFDLNTLETVRGRGYRLRTDVS